jgi:hypothetical protein
MTICIAAVCDDKREALPAKIVLCYDWKVSTAIGSAETKHKMKHIGRGWRALFAGNESEMLALTFLLRNQFSWKSSTIIDETNVVGLVRNAINTRKKEKADELTQGRYAISYDDFLKIGKEKFPPDIYRDTMAEIGNMKIGATCIVAGFTDIGGGRMDPMLIETEGNGRVAVVEDFTAIGEGAYLAQSALLQRSHIDVASLSRTIYCAYEAKKYAERVSSVGVYTSIAVMYGDGTAKIVKPDGWSKLLELFDKFGPQVIPEGITIGEEFMQNE